MEKKEQKHNYSVEDVAFTLKYGVLHYRDKLITLIVLTALAILAFLTSVTLFCIELFVNNNHDVAVLVFLAIISAAFATYFLCDVIGIGKIKKWLEDAEVINAKIKIIEALEMNRLSQRFYLVALFSFNGRKIEQKSKYRLTAFRQYVEQHGSKVPILYSPKYDQVMLIKNPKEKK